MLSKKDKETTPKFFTLILPGNNGDDERSTKVPAKKGRSLIDLVEPILETHNISFDSHSLFLESSKTPLPINSDTFPYGGNTLYVRENETVDVDKRVISLMMKGDKKGTTNANKRFSDLLLNFDCNSPSDIPSDTGFPGVDSVDSFDSVDGGVGEANELMLEGCWKDVIQEEDSMTNRQKVQQEAIWELFTTEINFIKDIKVIIDVFQKCFSMLQEAGYLTEIKQHLIFANIEEIYNVNVAFWKSLKETVDNARASKQPICPSHLLESFQGFENLFQPYITFCNADTSNFKLSPDPTPVNDMFKQYITWCDNHEQCKRITMQGFLIKPLQRVTKYSLLLKAILNKTDDEGEKRIAEEMRCRVETFVSKINSAVHLRQEQEKLDNVVARLSDYCPVEPVNDEVEKIIKEHCNLNFKQCIPGLSENEKRFILKEGQMKLVEKHGKKDVYAFLFSDVLVITKLKRNIDKYRINRQPYRLNKVVIRELKDPGQLLLVYLNEYDVAANAFVLQCELGEQEKWRTAIEKAKENYEAIRNEFGLRNDFWDDDPPASGISRNKVLRRHAAIIKKKEKVEVKEEEEDVAEVVPADVLEMKYEWDNVLTFVGMVMFVTFNVLISRFVGWW